MKQKIIIQTIVQNSLDMVWEQWTGPEHIMQWNFAADSWHCPAAKNELIEGGTFSYRMEAKDGSMGFDYFGTFEEIIPKQHLASKLGDERMVWVSFENLGSDQVEITETFEIEDQNSAELQRQGWQNILNNFKSYSEKKSLWLV